MIKRFFDDYKSKFDIIDFQPLDNHSDTYHIAKCFFIIKTKCSANNKPLLIEATEELCEPLDRNFVITDDAISACQKEIARVNTLLDEQVNKRKSAIFSYLRNNHHHTKPSLIKKMFLALLKEKDKVNPNFVTKYAEVSQLLYDLLPLVI